MRRVGLALIGLSCAFAGEAAAQGRPQPPDKKPPSKVKVLPPALGKLLQLQVVPLRPKGRAVRVQLEAPLPRGSVLQAWLVAEGEPPPFAQAVGRVKKGRRASLLLVLPKDIAPGFYEAIVYHDPHTQPPYLKERSAAPGQRAFPFVLGTVKEASRARDAVVASGSASASALVALAAELVQAFSEGSKPPTKHAFRSWLSERARARRITLREALRKLAPNKATDKLAASLRSLGLRVERGLAWHVRSRCAALEMAIPAEFAARRGEGTRRISVEELYVDALSLRARARRHELGPEPSRLTIGRVRKRLRWLGSVPRFSADITRPRVVQYVLADALLGIDRIRLPLEGSEAPGRAAVGRRLGKTAARLRRAPGDREGVAGIGKLLERTYADLDRVEQLLAQAKLRADLKALVALREGFLKAAAEDLTFAAWKRRLAVRRRLVQTPPQLRVLGEWLRQAATRLSKTGRKPQAKDLQRWRTLRTKAEAKLR